MCERERVRGEERRGEVRDDGMKREGPRILFSFLEGERSSRWLGLGLGLGIG